MSTGVGAAQEAHPAQRLSTFFGLALVLLLLAFAYSPVLRAGLLGEDYASLLGEPASLAEHPLGSWWLSASAVAWGIPAPGESAWPYRLENLCLWLGSAIAARSFLRRLLAPWVGEALAGAAAASAALFAILHPLAPSAVASLQARSELAGLFFALLSAALFLHGRQEEREPVTAASLVCLGIAALGSTSAVLVAVLLGAAEFSSARRHRRLALRLRTSVTTLGLFGCAALAPHLGLFARSGTPAAHAASLARLERLRLGVLGVLERLEQLFLPVRFEVLGFLGLLLAALVAFFSFRPAFRAARNAPRLWGAMLLAWSAALLLVLAWWTSRAGDANLGAAWRGLLAVVILASGLGLGANALPARRPVFSGLTLAVLALLAHANARVWLRASERVAGLYRDLARLELPEEAPLLVLDPPPPTQGVEPLGDAVGYLLHPRIEGAGTERPFDAGRVRALSTEAFLALLREPEFEELRKRSLEVLVPASVLEAGAQGRIAVPVPPSGGRAALRPWKTALTYVVDGELDPLDFEGAEVVADLSTPAAELERIAWRPRSGGSSACTGFVEERGAERVALYDLSGSLAWALGGRIKSVFLERGVRPIERGEFLEHLPAFEVGGGPVVEGADWVFQPAPRREASPGRESLELFLFSPSDYRSRRIPLEKERSGRLRARGAEVFAAALRSSGHDLVWRLEYRMDGLLVARLRGRS